MDTNIFGFEDIDLLFKYNEKDTLDKIEKSKNWFFIAYCLVRNIRPDLIDKWFNNEYFIINGISIGMIAMEIILRNYEIPKILDQLLLSDQSACNYILVEIATRNNLYKGNLEQEQIPFFPKYVHVLCNPVNHYIYDIATWCFSMKQYDIFKNSELCKAIATYDPTTDKKNSSDYHKRSSVWDMLYTMVIKSAEDITVVPDVFLPLAFELSKVDPIRTAWIFISNEVDLPDDVGKNLLQDLSTNKDHEEKFLGEIQKANLHSTNVLKYVTKNIQDKYKLTDGGKIYTPDTDEPYRESFRSYFKKNKY